MRELRTEHTQTCEGALEVVLTIWSLGFTWPLFNELLNIKTDFGETFLPNQTKRGKDGTYTAKP